MNRDLKPPTAAGYAKTTREHVVSLDRTKPEPAGDLIGTIGAVFTDAGTTPAWDPPEPVNARRIFARINVADTSDVTAELLRNGDSVGTVTITAGDLFAQADISPTVTYMRGLHYAQLAVTDAGDGVWAEMTCMADVYGRHALAAWLPVSAGCPTIFTDSAGSTIGGETGDYTVGPLNTSTITGQNITVTYRASFTIGSGTLNGVWIVDGVDQTPAAFSSLAVTATQLVTATAVAPAGTVSIGLRLSSPDTTFSASQDGTEHAMAATCTTDDVTLSPA